MKAVFIDRYGAADILQVGEINKPVPKDDQVLVKIYFSSLNPVDYKIRHGDLKILTGRKFPRFLGADFAGKIEAIGKSVSGFRVGDSIFGMVSAVKGGAHAEYLALTPSALAPKPANLNFAQAAALPLAGLTAYQALLKSAHMQPGEQVLINGSSGGVGHFAVQIAKAYGAGVTAVCSSENVEFCKNLGADEVIDYRKTGIENAGLKFDIVFDVVSNLNLSDAKHLLKPKGRYVATLPAPGKILRSLLNPLPGSRRFKTIMLKANSEDLKTLKSLTEQGKLTPHISHTFSLEEIAQAHRQMETGHTRGKIAIQIDHA